MGRQLRLGRVGVSRPHAQHARRQDLPHRSRRVGSGEPNGHAQGHLGSRGWGDAKRDQAPGDSGTNESAG